MSATRITLPEEILGYMESTEAEPGTLEWFQAAFHAIAQNAIDSGESLSEQFYIRFASEFKDGDELIEAAGEMTRKAGLDDLCLNYG